ncbi:CRISPR-associated protein Cas4 [Dechloromonas sp.]|uniref:CRISPR-associated protein Cas4 n=1 Tax=Dechloromonas sp. TaxID=1917218 RepID=UPI00121F60AA|nr:CRISPR-associated protein Cas4 [Dechloromonas sp.]MBU3697533.1 CRISPR-associated protein Cas4 [Dechloromonas sp.]TEX49771.1 MAG: CRISPR-associated protein Cas4 [Rhodocyclaceae bacterium]
MTAEPLDPIPLSALQHWAYCPRQCALIHVEQVFEENLFTQRGQALHQRVDDPGFELRDGLRIERALPLFCDRLGLVGKADVVEFLPDGTPYPVEYKHGSRHKRADIAACDDLQLAAQALCLEEMFGKPVPEGALYYATSRRRRIATVDSNLRAKTELTVAAVRQLLQSGEMPPPLNDDHCRACSLRDLCQPEALAPTQEHAAVRHSLFDVDD